MDFSLETLFHRNNAPMIEIYMLRLRYFKQQIKICIENLNIFETEDGNVYDVIEYGIKAPICKQDKQAQ